MGFVGEIDLPGRRAGAVPPWLTQLGVGLLCGLGAIALRRVLDIVAPGVGPFALVFPALILATVFAQWRAGALSAVVSILHGWHMVSSGAATPVTNEAADPGGIARLLIISVTAAVTLAIVESFRRKVDAAATARDREIADRDLFLAEFDHRMKNNFAIVVGLLDMQARRAATPATAAALETARLRVESIAQAHRHLYRGGDRLGVVEMEEYLGQLCAALSEALFLGEKITLDCDIAASRMPRDRAVSIGLVVNELVTNAAKHAFPGRESGRITVAFRERDGGWTLSVADDGVGLDDKPISRGSLGTRLIDAFARQAEGRLRTESGPAGTCVTLDLAD